MLLILMDFDAFKATGTMMKKKKPHGIGASESFRASARKGRRIILKLTCEAQIHQLLSNPSTFGAGVSA